MPGSLEIVSRKSAAANLETEAPCSVKTAQYPTVVFDVCPTQARPSLCIVGDVSLKRGVFEMTTVREGSDTNRSSVLLRLMTHV